MFSLFSKSHMIICVKLYNIKYIGTYITLAIANINKIEDISRLNKGIINKVSKTPCKKNKIK